jgi:hypothetical protein
MAFSISGSIPDNDYIIIFIIIIELMLAVSLLCKAKGNAADPLYAEAMESLRRAEKSASIDIAQDVCIKEVEKIRSEPQRTCGYTQAKYQEEIKEEDL